MKQCTSSSRVTHVTLSVCRTNGVAFVIIPVADESVLSAIRYEALTERPLCTPCAIATAGSSLMAGFGAMAVHFVNKVEAAERAALSPASAAPAAAVRNRVGVAWHRFVRIRIGRRGRLKLYGGF